MVGQQQRLVVSTFLEADEMLHRQSRKGHLDPPPTVSACTSLSPATSITTGPFLAITSSDVSASHEFVVLGQEVEHHRDGHRAAGEHREWGLGVEWFGVIGFPYHFPQQRVRLLSWRELRNER